MCQNGEKADAAMLQKSMEGSMGLIEGFKGALNAAKVKGAVEGFEVRGDHHLFIKTKNPDPGIFPIIGGHNYHLWWYGPAQYLLKAGHAEYVKNPVRRVCRASEPEGGDGHHRQQLEGYRREREGRRA